MDDGEYDMDDLSFSSDAQDNISNNVDNNLSSVSGSIPIHTSSKYTSFSGPLSFDKQTSNSEPKRTGSGGTPISNMSPSSSMIPRILRESFSKFLNRSSSQVRGLDKYPVCSDSEYSDNGEKKLSTSPTISPATQEVVYESLRNGLPIIPFAYPTFFTVGRCQEDIKRRMRKNSLKCMKRSFSEGKHIDYSDIVEEEDILRKDKSLDSIVKIAQQEIMNIDQDGMYNVKPGKESHSAYVEMNPEELVSSTYDDDPYMRMEDILEDNYLHMEKRKQSDERMFYLETGDNSIDKDSSRDTLDNLVKKPSKRRQSFYHFGKYKNELQIHERMGRHFKKGNKHKDDYVFFDFEKNKDYMDMGKAKTKKWHFLDFRNKK